MGQRLIAAVGLPDKLLLMCRQFFHALAQCGYACRMLCCVVGSFRGEQVEQFFAEVMTVALRRAEEVFHLVIGDPAGPRIEGTLAIVVRKFLPQQQTAPLENIFRIGVVRKQTVDVCLDSIAIGGEVSQKLRVVAVLAIRIIGLKIHWQAETSKYGEI